MGHTTHNRKSITVVTTVWLISARVRRAKGYIIVSKCTDIKLDDCDKHVKTDCKNDHSTSAVLGHSDQTFNKPYFDLCKLW